MAQHFLVFGNHPRLSLAEFLAIRPKAKVVAQTFHTATVELADWQDDVLMNALGGTIKLGEIIGQCATAQLNPLILARLMTQEQETGALEFGLTIYGANDKQKRSLEKFPIQIKKELKSLGWKVRWVSSPGGQPLSPAAVAKCHLIARPNADLCLLVQGEQTFVGRTTQVQDADAWSLRDYGRPCRDDVNGMLPPKLARMMVNLAQTPDDGVLLDPFCGSGTVPMEAALVTRAKKILGSDIAPKQIHDALTNLDWLEKEKIIRADDMGRFQIFESDVKRIAQHLTPKSVDTVVTEGWLGPLLKGHESSDRIRKNAAEIAVLWNEALKALHPVLKDKAKIVAIFPSFRQGSRIISALDSLDLEALGYVLDILPNNIKQEELYYERPDQHLRRNVRVLRAS